MMTSALQSSRPPPRPPRPRVPCEQDTQGGAESSFRIFILRRSYGTFYGGRGKLKMGYDDVTGALYV